MLSQELEARFLKIEEYGRPPNVTKEECLNLSKFFKDNQKVPQTKGQYHNVDHTAHCAIGLTVQEHKDPKYRQIKEGITNITKGPYRTGTIFFIISLNDEFGLSFLEQSLYWEWKASKLDKKGGGEK